MRLLICGDRNWDNLAAIKAVLQEIGPTNIEYIIEGGARGADFQAAVAAQCLSIKIKEFPANWKVYHRAAGPIRNTQMLREGRATHVIAFHDNIANSMGTTDMVKQARAAGVPVKVLTSLNHIVGEWHHGTLPGLRKDG